MAYLPRGIDPELLVSQVKNTMPYLFGSESEAGVAELLRFPAAAILRAYHAAPPESLSHLEYFRLCLSSHYLSVATPVPTDVDNQIRHKLWPAQLPLETALEMADLVIASRKWDFSAVTRRIAPGAAQTPWERETLSGHLGEWFTVSAGAYCALKQYTDPAAQAKREELFALIAEEVNRHSEIFGSLWRANDGLGCLKASASVAHNFGDLDRVMDMWDLGIEDPLRLRFYRLAAAAFDPDRKLRFLGRLWVAGELYKSMIDGSSMALENHRHFALRKPRCLRLNPEMMITTGPFLDEWGAKVARLLASADGKPSEDTHEVIEALKHGWSRMPKTLGYGRALRGILEVHPELSTTLGVSMDRVTSSREIFEKRWASEALKHMDEIPSRAT